MSGDGPARAVVVEQTGAGALVQDLGQVIQTVLFPTAPILHNSGPCNSYQQTFKMSRQPRRLCSSSYRNSSPGGFCEPEPSSIGNRCALRPLAPP